MNLFKKLIAAFYKDIRELSAAVTNENESDRSTPPADNGQPTSIENRKSQRLHDDLNALHCSEGLQQLHALQHKYRNFHAVLTRQLNPAEVTFSRYATVAEQVYLAALDNLEAAVVALQSISAVDVSGLRARLDDNSDPREGKKALRQRLTTWQEQNARIAKCLSQNENALTALDQAAAKLAAVRMTRGHAAVDPNTAIEELERLAKRAERYALNHND